MENICMSDVIDIEFSFQRYLELKELERQIKSELKILQERFDNYFTSSGISECCFGGRVLKRQKRKSISYPDDDQFKAYLESKGIWHLAVSPDKTKIDRLVKAGLLKPEKLAPFQKIKTTYAWVVEEVKKEG